MQRDGRRRGAGDVPHVAGLGLGFGLGLGLGLELGLGLGFRLGLGLGLGLGFGLGLGLDVPHVRGVVARAAEHEATIGAEARLT